MKTATSRSIIVSVFFKSFVLPKALFNRLRECRSFGNFFASPLKLTAQPAHSTDKSHDPGSCHLTMSSSTFHSRWAPILPIKYREPTQTGTSNYNLSSSNSKTNPPWGSWEITEQSAQQLTQNHGKVFHRHRFRYHDLSFSRNIKA